MKLTTITFIILSIALLYSCNKNDTTQLAKIEQATEKKLEKKQTNAIERWKHEFQRLRDPQTNNIPRGKVHLAREAALTAPIFKYSNLKKNSANITITSEGPNNSGGRARVIAFDVRNSQIMLSGGVSGGVFRSTNGGSSWTKVSPNNEPHNVTTIVQDPRAAHRNTWYYGTGEAVSNSADYHGTSYFGYGIYKSTDNGVTWSALANTQTGNDQYSNDNQFDYVHKLIVHPTSGDVYAGTHGSVYRSQDGGTNWSLVLGNGGNGVHFSDLVVTTTGTMYAGVSGFSYDEFAFENAEGVWTSTTGNNGEWNKLAGDDGFGSVVPTGWDNPGVYGRIALAIDPNNESVVYAYYQKTTSTESLFKYNGTGWTDLSANLPSSGTIVNNLAGYSMCIAIEPGNSNNIYIGGQNMCRSTDGFTSSSNTQFFGGNTNSNHHADVHHISFAPGGSDSLFTGSDGGLHLIDVTPATLTTSSSWTAINTDFVTYQFYYINISQENGEDVVLGGAQDNGVVVPQSAGSNNFGEVHSGDGIQVGIIDYTDQSNFNLISSAQEGWLVRSTALGVRSYIPPTGSTSRWFTLFHLDADNSDYLYYAATDGIYRTRMASSITVQTVTGNSATGWENMTGIQTKIDGDNSSQEISALATSRNETFGGTYTATDANRILYIGTDKGYVYKLTDPAFTSAATAPTDVSPTGMGGSGSYVSSISVHPYDDEKLLVTYSNYSTNSIWYSDNGGTSWTNVEGPSSGVVNLAGGRSSVIVSNNSKTFYLVGTSFGLYCTETLSGTTTSWDQVGSSSLSLSIIEEMDYRVSDQKIAVGTHGNGAYLLDFSPALPVELSRFEAEKLNNGVQLDWETRSETNNEGFEIQRSLDGVDWQKIGFVEGNGTTLETHNYSYFDGQPLNGINYYRLKQMDFDGHFEYSRVAFVEFKSEEELEIFPNPVQNDLNIINGEGVATIYNIQGQLIKRFTVNSEQFRTNTTDLPKGQYILSIQKNNGEVVTKRFIRSSQTR